MTQDAAVTIRLPAALKRELQARARHDRRSLSAHITAYLEREVEREAARQPRAGGKLLGRYAGTPVPSDNDFARVRRLLWGTLGRRRVRRAS